MDDDEEEDETEDDEEPHWLQADDLHLVDEAESAELDGFARILYSGSDIAQFLGHANVSNNRCAPLLASFPLRIRSVR